MVMKKKYILKFSKTMVDKPVVYKLVKEYNLVFNILKAEIKPDDEGMLIMELQGEDSDFNSGIDYLKKEGVTLESLSEEIILDEKKCSSCGYCISYCPVAAMSFNEKREVKFDKSKCIACEICIKICPFKAMKINI